MEKNKTPPLIPPLRKGEEGSVPMNIKEIFWNRNFVVPMIALVLLLAGLFLSQAIWYQVAVMIGMFRLLQESFERVKRGKWNLDYIALLTLGVASGMGAWLVGAVIAFMASVSAALEEYGSARAEKTLKELLEKFPKTVMQDLGNDETKIIDIHEAKPGMSILLRQNEMVPLDGELLTDALIDESNLTGEIEPMAYHVGAILRSGSINVGEMIRIMVTGDFEHSSYRRILSLVEEGKKHPSDTVRLAERYNIVFTGVTLVIAFGAYILFGDMERFLAVLAIATPCPLLIAAPISFIGGLNRAARSGIVVKSPKILELLVKTRSLFFDKTGTLTLGEPHLKTITSSDERYMVEELLDLAAALEKHSFHPVARAVVAEWERRSGKGYRAEKVTEKIGEGISGVIEGKKYRLVKGMGQGIAIDMYGEGEKIGQFLLDDVLKDDVGKLFRYLDERGYHMAILTGDRKENADRVFKSFRIPIFADCLPETKAEAVRHGQERGLVGIIGDGMNDAPALALADVGIVFSGTENSASIEAADIAVLGNDVWKIRDIIHIARKSYKTAQQSILIGIGLSLLGMFFAFFGFISPVQGAVLQEIIDVVVIVNALRSTY